MHIEESRKAIYVIIFILQLPFLFFDLYFAFTEGDKKCMDTAYGSKAYVVRPWLLAMGITEASIILFLFFAVLMRVCTVITHKCLKAYEYVSIGLLVVKIVLWGVMELILFFNIMSAYCHGGVYAYGLFQTIIHCGIIFILGVAYVCLAKR